MNLLFLLLAHQLSLHIPPHKFTRMTLKDLIYIASSINVTRSKLDILPSNLFKESFGVTAPWLLNIVNASLLSGMVPDYFKQACVQSLLEKPALDPTLPHNYHPIAKLPLL